MQEDITGNTKGGEKSPPFYLFQACRITDTTRIQA